MRAYQSSYQNVHNLHHTVLIAAINLNKKILVQSTRITAKIPSWESQA
ncbi:hypothetical protein Psfp_00008 [Pelotomaculum sp. FP]|nr:hypothetical protein [Pelotomaculum sp. FP]TEB17885.1 hypothetical protein Psfp_00008 [Pelotomaculum sp. FP]